MKAYSEQEKQDVADQGVPAAPSQTGPGLQQVICRLERIEAAVTDPRRARHEAGVAEPETATSYRLLSTMERIANALQVIARVQRPESQEKPLEGRSVVAMTADPDVRPNNEAYAAKAPENDGQSVASLEAQLAEIHGLLKKQAKQAQAAGRKSYTVDEVAELTGFKQWTIRDGCNRGRIKAEKSPDRKWRISHEELLKIQDEGLPPE
jgi:excisionase family DNA binding protein